MSRNSFLVKFYNYTYNFIFKKINNIKIDKIEKEDLVVEKIENLKHSKGLHTVWLLNIKRLYYLTKKKLNISDYHFIDVGCGNGIPLIYAYKKLAFKSYSGFDLITKYVDITKKNILGSINNCEINVFSADASKFILEDKNYFIFMFNPFNKIIMEKFLENNFSNFVKNKSIIAYANCLELETIKKFTRNVQFIENYKQAICYF